MKMKLTGNWFGLSFGVFLLVAAIVAIPAGKWIGGLLIRPGISLPQVQALALAQNPAETPADPANAALPSPSQAPAPAPAPQSSARNETSAPSALDALPSIPALGIAAASSAPRNVSAAKPPVAAAPGPERPAEAATAAVPSPRGTWLQVAALTREDNARTLADKLKSKGYPVLVKEPRRDTLYRVQVGPYPNPQAARTAAQSLKAAGFDALIAD